MKENFVQFSQCNRIASNKEEEKAGKRLVCYLWLKIKRGKMHCFMLRILHEAENWKRRQMEFFELPSKGQVIR